MTRLPTVLIDAGIATRPVWELMNRLPMFDQCECGDLSESEHIADCLVNLPSGVRLSVSAVQEGPND